MTHGLGSARRGDRRALSARLVLLVSALAGLFAMHGLGGHGMPHGESHDGLMVAATGHADHPPPAADGFRDVGSPIAPPKDSPTGMGMVGLCMAVLTFALLGLMRSGPRGRWVVLRRRVTPRAVGIEDHRGRERDPPCLFKLSIQRC